MHRAPIYEAYTNALDYDQYNQNVNNIPGPYTTSCKDCTVDAAQYFLHGCKCKDNQGNFVEAKPGTGLYNKTDCPRVGDCVEGAASTCWTDGLMEMVGPGCPVRAGNCMSPNVLKNVNGTIVCGSYR